MLLLLLYSTSSIRVIIIYYDLHIIVLGVGIGALRRRKLLLFDLRYCELISLHHNLVFLVLSMVHQDLLFVFLQLLLLLGNVLLLG